MPLRRQTKRTDTGCAWYPWALIVAFAAWGCSEAPRLPSLTPYKVDIQQGNFVTQEMVAKLKPGMTASQVRFILGTPLVVDAFHKDRWDYVYRYRHASGHVDQRRVTIFFKDDRVTEIRADELPLRDDASDPALPGARPGPAAGARP